MAGKRTWRGYGEVRRPREANDSNMANVRDSDTSLWLHNKLGTSNDSWTGSSICSQLNAEVLRNIKDCFPDLQTQVKLKLLLSFFHIPRRNVEEVSKRARLTRFFARYNRYPRQISFPRIKTGLSAARVKLATRRTFIIYPPSTSLSLSFSIVHDVFETFNI